MPGNKRNLLGKRLMILREEAGLTQEKLAEIFNTKKATISRYETGTRDPKLILNDFADYFVSAPIIYWEDGESEEVVVV